MVKSMISEALMRHEEEKKKGPEQTQYTPSGEDKELAELVEKLKCNIKIVGCGGAGSNTINRCVEEGITGAEMCAINTDARHLLTVKAPKKLLIGKRATKGLGAGGDPRTGEEAAKENEEEVRNFLTGAQIVFITAGMGGGTGTGSAPVVARLSKESGALTMGIVTTPFSGEGTHRMETAKDWIENLRRYCDTTVVIPNDKLLELAPRLPLTAAFKLADEILMTAIKGITEIITKPAIVNLDFADLKSVMKNGGVALIGLGESENTTDRINEAVTQALSSPLLGEIDISTAQGAMIRVDGGPSMTVSEAEKGVRLISSKISKDAKIIWGCNVDPTMENNIKVLLILTGVRSPTLLGKKGGFASGESTGSIDFIR